MKTETEIRKIAIEAVCGIQEQSRRPLPDDVCGTLRPIGDFEGFDSINAVEVAVQISERLGCEIAGNPFADGRRALKRSKRSPNVSTSSSTAKELKRNE